MLNTVFVCEQKPYLPLWLHVATAPWFKASVCQLLKNVSLLIVASTDQLLLSLCLACRDKLTMEMLVWKLVKEYEASKKRIKGLEIFLKE